MNRLAILPLLFPAALLAAQPVTKAELDELALRTYLYSRLGDNEHAMEYGMRVLEKEPDRIDTLLVLSSLWEDQPDMLEPLVGRLLKVAPENEQTLYFKAAWEYGKKQYANARDTHLANLRQNYGGYRRFPYLTHLAAASANAGDWRGAIYARREQVEQAGSHELLMSNRSLYDSILREYDPRLTLTGAMQAAPGRYTVTSFDAAAFSPLTVHTLATAQAGWNRASIRAGSGRRAAAREYSEGRIAADYRFNATWHVNAGAGVSDRGDPDATAAIWYNDTKVRRMGVEAVYTAPADDDAPYRVMNIRQSRVLLRYEDQISDRTSLSLSGGGRSLHLEDQEPKYWGSIFTGDLAYLSRWRQPDITPYLQTFWLSNPNNPSVINALSSLRTDGLREDIANTYDQQRAGIRAKIPLKSRLTLGGDAYVGTSFRQHGLLYGVGGDLTFRARKNLVLRVGGGWDKATLFTELPDGVARADASVVWSF